MSYQVRKVPPCGHCRFVSSCQHCVTHVLNRAKRHAVQEVIAARGLVKEVGHVQ